MNRSCPKLITALLALSTCILSHAKEPQAYRLEGDVAGAHDPSIVRQGKTYYVFTTGKASDGGQLGIRCSEDLTHWRHCGHVFDTVPQWIKERSPGTKDLWAPDISYANGRYRLYYAYSLFGKNTSGIALATNKTLDPASPDYKWQDEGLILESKATDDYNAIDPNYIEDTSHHAWLTFGSFWTGIKMRALDREDRKACRRGRENVLTGQPHTSGNYSRYASRASGKLAGDRGALHRASWPLLLSLRLLRSLLPRTQEHLQNHGRSRKEHHRPLPRPRRSRDEPRRRNTPARRQRSDGSAPEDNPC